MGTLGNGRIVEVFEQVKIVLVYPKPSDVKNTRFGYSLNLLYLASILRREGYQVEYIDYSLDKYAEAKLKVLLNHAKAVIIEFDSYPLKRSQNVEHGKDIIYNIRQAHKTIPIVVFGYNCILNSCTVSGCNFIYTWEPEYTIVDVINGLIFNIPVVRETILNKELLNFDWLPFPARDLLSENMTKGGDFYQPLAKSALIQTSRGCLNSCRFCQRKGWDKNYRFHSVNYSVCEFQELKENDFVNIWITDDNFTFNLQHAKGLLKELTDKEVTSKMKIALSSWTKIDHEFIDLAKLAGVSIISFGLESYNGEILKFYGKNIDFKQAEDIIEYADKKGIYTVGNFIIGAPMETDQTIETTFDYALSLPIDEVNMKILTYMPGAELFNDLTPEIKKDGQGVFACIENGLNNFPLSYLRERIDIFSKRFKNNRKDRLLKKIMKYGTPYILNKKSI
ncbi:MAG: hypothetical protein BWK80_04745 [Desulfobacteraceae bacterium IS3]|nr:MAG: hypothetical protein BWK80_04745 [Desulfobacteraceae bacterium IS3]